MLGRGGANSNPTKNESFFVELELNQYAENLR